MRLWFALFSLLLPCLAAAQAPIAPKLRNYEALDPVKYPGKAIRQELQGTVVVEISVDAEGRYLSHNVRETPGDLLSEAVTPYLPELAFYPAQQDGQAVPGLATLRVTFTIERKFPRRTEIAVRF